MSYLGLNHNLNHCNYKLSAVEMNKIEKAFHHADEGSKGYLLPYDVKVAVMFLFGYKLCKNEINQIVQAFGTLLPCGRKGLTLPLFKESMIPKFAAVEEDEVIRYTFKAFDTRCRGFLKLEDIKNSFKQVCPHLAEHKIELAFKEIDRDGDGRLSYKDFDFMMKFNNLL